MGGYLGGGGAPYGVGGDLVMLVARLEAVPFHGRFKSGSFLSFHSRVSQTTGIGSQAPCTNRFSFSILP